MNMYPETKRTWKPATDNLNQLFSDIVATASDKGYSTKYPVKLYTMKSTNLFGWWQAGKDHDHSIILINEYILDNKEKTINTLIHEFAHALAPARSHHNHVWYNIANDIGRKYNTTITRCENDSELCNMITSHSKETYKYIIRCTKCGHEYKRKRKCGVVEHPEFYTCGHCNGKLEIVM